MSRKYIFSVEDIGNDKKSINLYYAEPELDSDATCVIEIEDEDSISEIKLSQSDTYNLSQALYYMSRPYKKYLCASTAKWIIKEED